MISLKQLNYALAVQKTHHFRKAAALCHVSQSALSTAITELESQLDVQIFERDNKKVLLTAVGKQILEKAQSVKMEVDNMYLLSQNSKASLSTPLTIGVIPTIAPYLLPKVLPAVRRKYPDFRMNIIEEQSEDLVEKVKAGDIDTAILAMPYDIDGLFAFEFWKEDFWAVCNSDDELASQTEISSQQLLETSLLLLKDGHCLKEHALAACRIQQQETFHSLSGTSLHTLVQMVAGHMGTTLVPQMALDQLIGDSSELTAIHLNEPGPHRRLAFIVRPNYAGVDNVELLMDLFRQTLNDLFPRM